jgi:hypothetical protein
MVVPKLHLSLATNCHIDKSNDKIVSGYLPGLRWVLFSVSVGVALAIDLCVIGKELRSTSDALAWTIVWISLGLIFAGVIYFGMCYGKMQHICNI